MNRLTRQQAIGLCLLLLISSSEGVRVDKSISLNSRVNENAAAIQSHVAKQMAALQAKNAANEHTKWITGWFRNFKNSACPADMSIDNITKRFAYKSEKLQTTANAVASYPLLVSKGRGKIRELVMRAEGLQLCSAAEKARPELKGLVENPDSGVHAQLTQVYKTFVAAANRSGVISWNPDLAIGCTMDLKVDVSSENGGDVVKAFQKSFYGEKCDVAAYQAKQPATSRDILERLEENFKKMVVQTASGESVDKVIEELVVEAEQSNDDDVDASSLMELADGANEGLAIPPILVPLLSILLPVLLFLLLVLVGVVFFS